MASFSNSPKNSVILLSGGLDSAANLAFCREHDNPILAVIFRYGQRAEEREVRAARALSVYYGVRMEVVELPWLGQLGGSALTENSIPIPHFAANTELDQRALTEQSARQVWIPNRNGVFINIGACFAERLGAERVVVGFNREEAATFPDNSQAFIERATASLAYSSANRVQVFSYTVLWDKKEIAMKVRKLSRPFPFDKIWSCYEGGASPCGHCESCHRFERAIHG